MAKHFSMPMIRKYQTMSKKFIIEVVSDDINTAKILRELFENFSSTNNTLTKTHITMSEHYSQGLPRHMFTFNFD